MADYTLGTPIEITDTFTVDGIPTDPTLVTYSILGPDGVTTTYVSGDPEVSNPAVGEFVLSLSPPGNPGSYSYSVVATGAVEASRFGSFYVIPNPAVPDPDVEWAVVGPCEPWVSAQAVWECAGSPMTTIGEGSNEEECPVDMTQYALEASQLLYEMSGRLYSGACQKTVIACEDWCDCGFQVLSRGYVVGPWSAYGWGWEGFWWPSCWTWSCGCPAKVKLSGYPIREITEVKIDGVVLDPADYKLYDRRYLARVDGGRWPTCIRLCRDGTEEENTITYRYGQDPPPLGIHAAAQLGAELYKACTGQDCALPNNVVSYTRQGVTVQKLAFSSWAYQKGGGRTVLAGWRTGMNLVDSFLSGYNPAGIKRRPVFYAPGHRRYRRPVGQ